MVTLICPRCSQQLTVSPMAPRNLSCPRCLARIDNPGGADALVRRDPSHPPPLPVPVMAVDEDIGRDKRGVDVLLVLLAILFGGGAFLSFYVPGARGAAAILTVASAALLVIA